MRGLATLSKEYIHKKGDEQDVQYAIYCVS